MVMKLFLVYGLYPGDDRSFENYGIFSTKSKAEDCVLSLQVDFPDLFCYIQEFELDEMS